MKKGLFLLVAVCLLLTSCGDDKITNTGDVSGQYLYVTAHHIKNDFDYLLKINTSTNDIVKAGPIFVPYDFITITPDNKKILLSSLQKTFVYDTENLEYLFTKDIGREFFFDVEEEIGITSINCYIFNYETMEIIGGVNNVITVGIDTATNSVFTITGFESSPIIRYTYKGDFVDLYETTYLRYNEVFALPEGDLVMSTRGFSSIDSTTLEERIYFHNGTDIILSHDRTVVYSCSMGDMFHGFPPPPNIYLSDTRTGQYLDSLSTVTEINNQPTAVDIYKLELSSDGKYLYAIGSSYPYLFRYDLTTGEREEFSQKHSAYRFFDFAVSY